MNWLKKLLSTVFLTQNSLVSQIWRFCKIFCELLAIFAKKQLFLKTKAYANRQGNLSSKNSIKSHFPIYWSWDIIKRKSQNDVYKTLKPRLGKKYSTDFFLLKWYEKIFGIKTQKLKTSNLQSILHFILRTIRKISYEICLISLYPRPKCTVFRN